MTYTGNELFEIVYDYHEDVVLHSLQELKDTYSLELPELEIGKGILKVLSNGHKVLVTRVK